MSDREWERDRLQWAMEELQAANQELELSKEELQSMNEELLESSGRVVAVNAELEGKIRELKSATSDLASLVDGTDVATVFLDRDRFILRFTPAMRRLMELHVTDVGQPFSHVRLELEDSALMSDIERVQEGSEPAEAITQGRRDRWFLRRIVPYRTADGHANGVVVTFTDITLRHKAEEALRQANEELESRVRQRTAQIRLLQDVAVIANNAGPMNVAFADILQRICREDKSWIAGHVYVVRAGWAEDSGVWHVDDRARGERLRRLLGERSFGPGEGLVGRVVDAAAPAWSTELSLDERFRQVEADSLGVRSVLVFPILIGERVVGAFEFFSRGIDEPGPALLEVMRNVGTQLGRVIEREEARVRAFDFAIEEQRSVGEELHETLSQQIHGLSMLAQSLVQTAGATDLSDGRLRVLVDGLVETHRQIRSLSSGLVPVCVEAGGLRGALEEMARGWLQMHGTECIFEPAGDVDPDDERVSTALYRIAREAARNAVLHGVAERIVIRLEEADGQLELEVRDDGQGMSEVPVSGPGMGLQIMRHRADLVGGTLEILSSPGSGTVVRCTIPVPGGRGVGSQS